jgi:hypothetical protein
VLVIAPKGMISTRVVSTMRAGAASRPAAQRVRRQRKSCHQRAWWPYSRGGLLLLSRKVRLAEFSAWRDSAPICSDGDSNLPGRERWIFRMAGAQKRGSAPMRRM